MTQEQNTPLHTAQATLRAEAAALTHLADTIGDTFMAAVNLIHTTNQNGGRVIVCGMGKSGHIGNKIAATFASTGTPSFFVHPSEASHGDLGMITKQDCVLAIGHSGETKEMGDVLHYCTRFAIPLIAITGKETSTLGQAATIVLLNGVTKEACPVGKAPTTSSTASLALADALATALMTKRQFSKEDFLVFHPGGKLGAQLLTIKDIMIAENLPLVTPGTPTTDLLIEMADKNLGAVGVIDEKSQKLIGIFTDGDLKRHMNPEFLTKTTQEVMSDTPKTISGTSLATQGIAQMESQGISCLFVVDADNQPVGLFRLQECLTAGVI